MRFLALPLALAVVLAGCAARGSDDPLAYTRKPLYVGGFALAQVAQTENLTQSQQFWVSDGSIGEIHVQVWVNATKGGARVIVTDPSGHVALDTTTAAEQGFGLNLGAWKVTVEAEPESAGLVGVLVTRR